MSAKTRREDLDRAKGLGILLVVIGHIVARDSPTGNEWYVALKNAIYLFHMPFFMYLSGYTTFMTRSAYLPMNEWPTLVSKRAKRLLLPLLVFGMTIVAGKLLLGTILHIDNRPGTLIDAVYQLIWDTDLSPAGSIWYIAVLFILCVVTPPLLELLHNRAYVLFAIALVLYFVPVPHVMYLDRAATFYVFFMIGGLAAESTDRWMNFVDRTDWLFGGILAAAIGSCFFLFTTAYSEPIYWLGSDSGRIALLTCGCLSIPALHGLVRRPFAARSTFLIVLGTYSFVIYLLNTPSIGVAKGVMWHFADWNGARFLVYAPVLLVTGIAGPILIKRLLLTRVRALDTITS